MERVMRLNSSTIQETHRYEKCIADLRTVLALRSSWSGHSAARILQMLCDVLLHQVDLNFTFARLTPKVGADACEAFRYAKRRKPGSLSIASIPIGGRERIGTLIAGASRNGFPTELEQLVLDVAASQVCVTLQELFYEESRKLAIAEAQTAMHAWAAELNELARLHAFSTCLLDSPDEQTVLELMLDSIIELQQANFGNVQLTDPASGGLVIAAQRNFQPPFLERFALVRHDDQSACARAVRAGLRVIIEDVSTDEQFEIHRPVAAEAGFRALQSTPLLGHRGHLLGIVSTHFRNPHRPSHTQLRLTDLYVRYATQAIERKRAEEERGKLAAIVQDSSDFIGIASLDGQPIFVNEAGRRMVGLRSDEPLPGDLAAYIVQEDRERLRAQIMPAVEEAGFWDGEISLYRFDTGAEIPVLQHIFYIREPGDGRRVALATVCRDITERKRAQRAASQAQQELARATRILGMGELTASIAHELNQPLTAIIANGSACHRWIEREVPNLDEARASMHKIICDANRASEIIGRIRGLALKATPTREPRDINTIIHAVLAIMADELTRDHILLRLNLTDRMPRVFADHIEMQQVVLNLIMNSIDALRPVFGRARELLIISSTHEPAMIEVSVSDNGVGVAPQDLPRLLEPLFTTKPQGIGVGLAISRRIIESHGGSLRAMPNTGHGLTLSFTLPTIEAS